jgi:hypothetical protein
MVTLVSIGEFVLVDTSQLIFELRFPCKYLGALLSSESHNASGYASGFQ